MLREFKEFAIRGNVVDLAIALVIGAAFGAIVNSLVKDIIMPLVGLLLGGVDFVNMFVVLSEGDPAGPYTTPALAAEAGAVTWNYGIFINTIITFIIVAFAIFILVKMINRARKAEEAAETKDCPFCLSAVPIPASRCPQCTSALDEA